MANTDSPPGMECGQEVADAFHKFMETAATLIGRPQADYTDLKAGGLAFVCVIAHLESGHTSNWSNLPVGMQHALLVHHIRLGFGQQHHATPTEPN